MSRSIPPLALALVCLLLPPGVHAQGGTAVAVLGGPSQFDLSGTGTSVAVSFRASHELSRILVLEGAVAHLPYTTQADDDVHHLFPELQLQLQWPGRRALPYLGAGVGASWGFRPETTELEATLSGTGGVRIPVAGSWAIQAELRVRSVDPWTGTTADWGLGLTGTL